jgi:hypothetical protein
VRLISIFLIFLFTYAELPTIDKHNWYDAISVEYKKVDAISQNAFKVKYKIEVTQSLYMYPIIEIVPFPQPTTVFAFAIHIDF